MVGPRFLGKWDDGKEGDTIKYLGCEPVDFGTRPVRGSLQITASCGHRVWIAPSGTRMVSSEGAVPICMVCIVQKISEEDPDLNKIEKPSREQVREVIEEVAFRQAERN